MLAQNVRSLPVIEGYRLKSVIMCDVWISNAVRDFPCGCSWHALSAYSYPDRDRPMSAHVDRRFGCRGQAHERANSAEWNSRNGSQSSPAEQLTQCRYLFCLMLRAVSWWLCANSDTSQLYDEPRLVAIVHSCATQWR